MFESKIFKSGNHELKFQKIAINRFKIGISKILMTFWSFSIKKCNQNIINTNTVELLLTDTSL